MNYIKQYCDKIELGEIIVSKRVQTIYKRLLSDIESGNWVFDEHKGSRPIEFIEKFCKNSKGEWFRKPLKLELFQKAFIQALFGFTDSDGLRRFRETFFLVARKNGKSCLLSAIMLYMLIADGEGGAQIVTAATKKDQARIVFDECVNMAMQSPELSKYLKKRKTDLYFPTTFSTMMPLSSESNTLDGLNLHVAVVDELHAIKDRSLYEVLKQGMSARRQPLMVMITTSGTVRECIYDDMYDYACQVCDGAIKDDRFLPILYELDSRDEWTDYRAWMKANPGLGPIKKYDDIVEKVERAKKNSKELPGILCKDFNVRDTVTGSWLNFEDIDNTETYDIKDHMDTYAIGGVDLSSTTDLTCATLMWKKDDKLFINQKYFIPRDVAELKEHEDKVPYSIWEKQGWVTFTEGAKVDYSDVTKWFVTMRDEYKIFPLWVGFDNWNAQYFTIEMQNNNFCMEQVIQGARTMSPAMKQLEGEFRVGNIVYNNNPVLKWNLTNTQIKTDDNENIRPIKGRNPKLRIDGTVSLIDAFVIYMKHYEDYNNLL